MIPLRIRDLASALLCVLLLASAAPREALASDSSARLVAVLPLSAGKLTPAEVDVLEETLYTVAAERLSRFGYIILSKETQLQVLEDNGIDPDVACEASCALGVARELQARLFLSGSTTWIEGTITGFIRLHETDSGKQIGSLHLEGRSVLELRRQIIEGATNLFARADRQGGDAGVVEVRSERSGRRSSRTRDRNRNATRELPAFVDILAREPGGKELTGARIRINGRQEGIAPRTIPLEPGVHTVTLERDFHFAKSIEVAVVAGETKQLAFILEPNFGFLSVESTPPGATVTLGGVAIGETPLRQQVRTGEHELRLELPDYVPWGAAVDVAAGGTRRISQKLRPDFGPLEIRSEPSGARVLLDGKEVGTTPLTLPRVTPGRHRVRVSAAPESYEPFRTEVIVERERGAPPLFARLERREADLVVTTQPPGATVSIDGKTLGTTTFKARLLGGSHRLQVSLPGYMPVTKQITLLPPEPLLLNIELQLGGSGLDGRFTAADLGLEYLPEPPRPQFPKAPIVEVTRPTLAFTLFWVSLAAIGTSFAMSTVWAETANYSVGIVGAYLLLPSLGMTFLTASFFPHWFKTSMEPDPRVLAENDRKQREWERQVAKVSRHNAAIERTIEKSNRAIVDAGF